MFKFSLALFDALGNPGGSISLKVGTTKRISGPTPIRERMGAQQNVRKWKNRSKLAVFKGIRQGRVAKEWTHRHWIVGRDHFMAFPREAKITIGVAFAVGLVGNFALQGLERLPGLFSAWRTKIERVDAPAVTTATAEMTDLADKFTVYATLQPLREAVLRPPSQVVVSDVLVKIGDRVKRGQTLAVFRSDAQNLRSELEQIDLQRKQMDIELTLALSKKNFVSNREVRQSELDRRATTIQRKLNEIEGSRRIISPIDGVVAELTMLQGDYIDQVQNFAIRVIQPEGYRVQAYVPGNIAARLKAGSEAEIAAIHDTHAAMATLNTVGATLDPKTGSVFVDVTADDSPGDAKVGSIVELRLVMERNRAAIAVPTQALVWKKGEAFVFKLNTETSRAPASTDGEALAAVDLVPVKLGIRGDSLTEVREGLEEGARIVTRGQSGLAPGAAVRVVD